MGSAFKVKQKFFIKKFIKNYFFFTVEKVFLKYLKPDSQVPEKFCQIKIIPSLVLKNAIICLIGV